MAQFQPGRLLQPIAPGLSGALNPLMFIGSGMARGDIGGSLGQMAGIQQAQQQLLQNRAMQQAQMDRMAQETQMRQEAAEMTAAQQRARQQLAASILGRQTRAAPPTEPGQVAERPPLTAEQSLAAIAAPDAIIEAQYKFMPVEGGKGGFFHPLTGQFVAPPGGAAGQAAPEFGDISSLRKEYTAQSKPWQEQRRAFERIMATEPTGAGDIALLTSYMKVLDPGSTVREGEFATAANAGGVSDRVRGMYNQLVRGEGQLTPELRTQFKSQAASFMEGAREEQLTRQQAYRRTAQRQNMDLQEAVPDYLGDYAADDWRDALSVPTYTPPVAQPGSAAAMTAERMQDIESREYRETDTLKRAMAEQQRRLQQEGLRGLR